MVLRVGDLRLSQEGPYELLFRGQNLRCKSFGRVCKFANNFERL
jgi:hypothetical protein